MFVILTRVDQVDCATVCRLFDRAHDGVVRDGVSNSPEKCCKRASVVQQSHQVCLVLTAEVGDLHPDFVAGLLSTTRIRKANKKVYYYYC